ncbi:MAG TPA: hypothetical protein VNK41_03510 [Vicinamibacterales bacterium]|nr:hypothetical protein [Vicinamibacterales bacterium]
MIVRAFGLALLVCWCMLFAERPAEAYLDPGSGSMLLQVILGGVAGVAVIAKLYWGRLLALLGIRREPPKE